MSKMSVDNIIKLKKNFEGKKVAVIGDMMLDGYFWGIVNRISPEAPVPVIEIDDEFFRFGGAANVALNILKLGGIPYPIGIIGNDQNGEIFTGLLKEAGISSEGIIVDKERPTTCKTRVISGKQHVVRIDKESKNNISKETEKELLEFYKNLIPSLDAVILEDYNKGVLTPNIIKQSVDLANKSSKIITVDPKFNNFFDYKNVTVFKPNRKETEDAFGIRIKTEADIAVAGKKLFESLKSKYVLLTLGEQGVALFENGTQVKHIPTKARKVADVSGAGDTVIATLTMALTAQAPVEQAAYLANFAGGLVCQEVGIVPIEADQLFEAVISELK